MIYFMFLVHLKIQKLKLIKNKIDDESNINIRQILKDKKRLNSILKYAYRNIVMILYIAEKSALRILISNSLISR